MLRPERNPMRGEGKCYSVWNNAEVLVGYVANEKLGWANNWHIYDAEKKHIGHGGYTRKEAVAALFAHKLEEAEVVIQAALAERGAR